MCMRGMDWLLYKGVLLIELSCGPRSVVVLNTHLNANYSGDWRRENRYAQVEQRQLAQLAEVVAEQPADALVLVAGDFNIPRGGWLYDELLAAAGLHDPLASDRRATRAYQGCTMICKCSPIRTPDDCTTEAQRPGRDPDPGRLHHRGAEAGQRSGPRACTVLQALPGLLRANFSRLPDLVGSRRAYDSGSDHGGVRRFGLCPASVPRWCSPVRRFGSWGCAAVRPRCLGGVFLPGCLRQRARAGRRPAPGRGGTRARG
jgi:hypothetical protein